MRTSSPRIVAIAIAMALAVAACANDSPTLEIPAGAGPGLSGSGVGNGLVSGDPSGEPAPDLAFELSDGTKTRLADYQGQPLVLNFFASWCAPCVREMPDVQAVHLAVEGRVQILGINFQDLPGDTASIIDETGVTYPYAIDSRGDFLVEFQSTSMPSTVFIDSDGNIVEVNRGELSKSELEAKLAEYFDVRA